MPHLFHRFVLWFKQQPLTALAVLVWLCFFIIVWSNMFTQTEQGIFVGHPFVWADWSMHLAHINWFSEQAPERWLSCQPTYACARFNYPFMTNLISGLLLRANTSLTFSILLPSLVFSVIGTLFLAKLYTTVVRKDLPVALALLIALASGGMGVFLAFGAALIKQPLEITSWTAFTQLSSAGIEFTNIFLAMLLPQRAFLLGLGIALAALIQVWKTYLHKTLSRSSWIVFSISMGILPFAHSHSFLVVGWITIFLALWQTVQTHPHTASTAWRWGKLGLPSLFFFGLIYHFFLQSPDVVPSFATFHLGWMAKPGVLNWLQFWFLNWGVFGLLAIIGTLLFKKEGHPAFSWSIAGWSLFLVANVFQLQPQIWDNSKVFAWAYILLAPTAAFALLRIKTIRWIGGVLAALLFFCTIASGLTDLLRMQHIWSQPIELASMEQLQLTKFIRQNTPAESIFLTAEYPANPITLAGRAIVMGYPGWAFSHGLPHVQRSKDIREMYQSPRANRSLFSTYQIRYVFLGLHEASYQPETAFFEQNFTAIFSNSAGTLYDLTQPR